MALKEPRTGGFFTTRKESTTTMRLCHKCDGTFRRVDGLNECQCISSYVRGFEEDLTLEQAATKQAERQISWLSLYVTQNRPPSDQAWKNAFDHLMLVMETKQKKPE